MNLNLYRDADQAGLIWEDRMIDIVDALDLLDSCVRDRGEDYRSLPRRLAVVSRTGLQEEVPAASDSIVTLALRKAGAPPIVLSALADAPVADLYASGRPALNLTLGAVVVFRAAESAERRGQTWANSLHAALRAASRFVELIPDRVAAHATEPVAASHQGAPLAQHVTTAPTAEGPHEQARSTGA
jgi:hypothetical protein